MSRLLTLALVLLIPTATVAAPVPSVTPGSRKPLSDAQRAEADVFAPMLLGVCNQIVDQYLRPVPRHELLYAALTGLYERAQRKPPVTLYNDCQLSPDQASLVKLILLVREDIGDAEGLHGMHPLLIGCQAMAKVLDPYSGVVSGEEQRRNTGLEQDNRGIGLEIGDNPGGEAVIVKLVKPGGPAQRSGLRPGDAITHVDGQPVAKLTTEKLVEMLNHTTTLGPPSIIVDQQAAPDFNQPVQLAYRRGEAKPATVTLDRTRFRAETVLGVNRNDNNLWNYWLDPKERIAHVRIATLGKGTSDELREVIDRLKQDGLRGLILDLRWCPGGFLDESVDCARLFLGEGVVSTVKMRTREPITHRNAAIGQFADLPLVVLVNGDTMGGAELIAAALQDHGRARVVGQRTFGKASVQTPLHLGAPGMGMKLTTGTFERPNGKNLHRFADSKPSDDWGVRPDEGLEFRLSADLNRQLRAWWLEMTLRPGSSRERLALDDAHADAPQQAALEALQKLLEPKVRVKGNH